MLKEVTEILFGESLIKCLFATETFAMGVNMPAKTVVFTACRKFDGTDFRMISAGEYIQMSGRAGRRGLDDRGIVIQMVDEKLDPGAAKEMLKGCADPLLSTFHLGYNMVLNLLRVEDADPEFMIRNSFYQFQAEEKVPQMKVRLLALEAKCDSAAHDMGDDGGEARAYFSMSRQMGKLNERIRQEWLNHPKYILPFLQPGRLVRVRVGDHTSSVGDDGDFGWGVVVSYTKRSKGRPQKGKKAVVSTGGEDGYSGVLVDVLLRCAALAENGPANPTGKAPNGPAGGAPVPRPYRGTKAMGGEMRVVPVLLPLLDGCSAVRIYLPTDLRPLSNRAAVGKSVLEVQRRFPDGLPLLDPVQDMKIPIIADGSSGESTDVSSEAPALTGYGTLIKRVERLQSRMVGNSLHSSPERDKKFALCLRHYQLSQHAAILRREIKNLESLGMKDKLKGMVSVLRRLSFASKSNVVELKGRTACEISTADELLVTELIFCGVFNDLSPNLVASLCSALVFTEKGDDKAVVLPDLRETWRAVQDAARRVARAQRQAKIEVDEEEYVAQFKVDLMAPVDRWCHGAKFSELCAMSDVFEGSLIRSIRRLEELLRQMQSAAKAIGDSELERKFKAARGLLKRDIVFAASLYIC